MASVPLVFRRTAPPRAWLRKRAKRIARVPGLARQRVAGAGEAAAAAAAEELQRASAVQAVPPFPERKEGERLSIAGRKQ